MAYEFNVKEQAEKCIAWTREHVNAINPNAIAVIGISGGKDSSCCAAIMCEALGKDRAPDILLPNSKQVNIDDSKKLCVSYHKINTIIRTDEKTEHYDKVVSLYKKSRFKLDIVRMPGYDPGLYDYFFENLGL